MWVPGNETEDYDEHLRAASKDSQRGRTAGKQNIATADAWSSDEDDP